MPSIQMQLIACILYYVNWGIRYTIHVFAQLYPNALKLVTNQNT